MNNNNEKNTSGEVFETSIPDNSEADNWIWEHMWLKGNRERFVKRNIKFYTETLPASLKRLDKVATAFSKVKLNERGLPW